MSARFAAGDRVRIEARHEPRHHRVPGYVKGQVGRVERVCAPHGEPERLAYGDETGPERTVYRVRLRQGDLWPDYEGRDNDSLDIEIFEHWLRPA